MVVILIAAIVCAAIDLSVQGICLVLGLYALWRWLKDHL